MAGKSVGVLSLFLNLNAAGLFKEFNKVDRQLARWSQSWTKPGAKLALGFLGVQNALSMVTNAIRHVVQNIEKIPGVPAETVESIVTMRNNLASLKTWVDQNAAAMVGRIAKTFQAVGVGFAGLMGHTDTSGLSKQETPDEVAASKDPGYWEKVTAARRKVIEATKAHDLAMQSEVQQIITLRQEAERYAKFATSNSQNSVDRLNAEAEGLDKLRQASAKMSALRKQLEDAEKKSGEAFGGVILAGSSKDPQIRMEALKTQEASVRRRLADSMHGDQNDPANIKSQIVLREQLTKIYERQVPLLERQNALAKEVGVTIGGAFENAVFQGGKLSDMLRQLATDLMRMLFRENVTSGLSSGISSFVKGLLGAPAANGGYRDGSRPYLVGEKGPEVFMPGVGGTVIPNHALRNGGGGGGGLVVHQTNNFASGVTRQEVASLLPHMVEASKRAVVDAVSRGGGFKRAFA